MATRAELWSRTLAVAVPLGLPPVVVSHYVQDAQKIERALETSGFSTVYDSAEPSFIAPDTASLSQPVGASGLRSDDPIAAIGDSGVVASPDPTAGTPASAGAGTSGWTAFSPARPGPMSAQAKGSPAGSSVSAPGPLQLSSAPLQAGRTLSKAAQASGSGSGTGTLAASSTSAAQDVLATSRNVPLVFSPSSSLLANDSGIGIVLDSIDAASVSSPPGAITQLGTDQYSYAPALNFTGTDRFYYRISSPGGLATGTVLVTVSPKTPPGVGEIRSGTATTSPAVSTSSPLSPVIGNLYVAFVSHSDDAITVTAVNGLGLSWTFVDRQCSAQGHHGLEAWYAVGTAPSSSGVTAGFSSNPANAQIAVARISGAQLGPGAVSRANSSGSFGACGGGAASKAPSADINLSSADARVISAVSFSLLSNTHSPVQATELLEIGSGTNPQATHLAVQTLTSPTPGNVSLSSLLGAAGFWATISVELVPQ